MNPVAKATTLVRKYAPPFLGNGVAICSAPGMGQLPAIAQPYASAHLREVSLYASLGFSGSIRTDRV